MTSFEEYAALARQLSAQRRGEDKAVAAAAQRRSALDTAADQLGQRLAVQRQRLDQLGRAFGAAAADAGRTPSGADADAAAPPAGAAPELAAAGQLADEADRHGQQADVLARRPALLPTWSPLARAAAVYTCAALAGAVLMLVMVVASGLAVVGLGTLYASMCAGLPVASFVAGYLVLGRWGRPVLDGDAPVSRFVPLGFVICVLLVPLVYCAYLLAFRVLR
ncbi:hypothetical protein OG799_02770 [Micromonospora sp. NBC_00898]|uniref:hypothetical protein n=1 Tax=Micromonospora sp. NBC_00898 TaxID=2975981 RepID=UPI00386C2ABE|nr:hypothetical protein OG799_02770 [Micromonospora sp. NBC_00898]